VGGGDGAEQQVVEDAQPARLDDNIGARGLARNAVGVRFGGGVDDAGGPGGRIDVAGFRFDADPQLLRIYLIRKGQLRDLVLVVAVAWRSLHSRRILSLEVILVIAPAPPALLDFLHVLTLLIGIPYQPRDHFQIAHRRFSRCRPTTMLPSIAVALGCARRRPAVHPTAPGRHRRRLARFPAPRSRYASVCNIHLWVAQVRRNAAVSLGLCANRAKKCRLALQSQKSGIAKVRKSVGA
jgi:hypothetical protein